MTHRNDGQLFITAEKNKNSFLFRAHFQFIVYGKTHEAKLLRLFLHLLDPQPEIIILITMFKK